MTQKELCEKTGVSRQYIGYLRNGYTKKGYDYPPILIEGEHWHWERGTIVFEESAVAVVQAGRPKKEKPVMPPKRPRGRPRKETVELM